MLYLALLALLISDQVRGSCDVFPGNITSSVFLGKHENILQSDQKNVWRRVVAMKMLMTQNKNEEKEKVLPRPVEEKVKATKEWTKNFASQDCGAKIISNSDNINNPQHVIMRNEDEYLIYPCDQDASFTIELCENIKILRVELANYELFSGTPAHFAVFTSDKFSSDTSDWVTVGNFNIDSEKMKHQVFSIVKAKGFGKFLRIKLDTFHGSEHYCTLTSFKVFGITEYEYVAMKDNEEITAPAALDSIDSNMFGVSSSKHQTMFVLYQYLFLHPFQNVCQIDSKEESEDEETQNQRESVLINLATKIKMCEKNSSHLANELNNLKTTLEMNKKEFLKAEKKHKDEMEALTEQIQFLQMMQKNLQESLGAVVGLFLIVIVVSKFFDFCNSRRWYMKKKKKGLEMAASAKPQLSVPQAKRVTFEVNDALENVLKDNMFGRNEQNFQRRVTWCSGSLRKNINRSN